MNSIIQVAYVVPDLHEGIDHWVRRMGAGPFFLMEHMKPENPLYRGQPLCPDYSAALGFSGSLQIELIQQHDDTPSIYKEFVDRGGYGCHHILREVRDVAAAVAEFEKAGCPAVWSGNITGIGPFAYVDAAKQLGGYVELFHMSPLLLQLWAHMADASSNWDGSDPIRQLPPPSSNQPI